ncbi:MAG: 6-phosphofructokinase [Phycisphaeraceae bacterium]|nr:6-phosphofructokinase [Phycisphaeraceae bacterium]
MADLPKGNAAIGQSGGPTAVINQSLVACALALKKLPRVKKVLGMRHGVNGLVKDQIVDLGRVREAHLREVAATPSAALGSSRDKPDRAYCEQILASCRKHEIRYFFYIGGNDSSDTCRIVNELARGSGYELRCFHIPKTVDNDLMLSDHTPGFPSAARFLALAFMSDSLDNASLPGVKINVVMGRHAGFLTGAAALARGEGKDADRNGPHLIYVPEVPFDSQRFVEDVERVYARLGRCQVAVSEGVQNAAGAPIATTLVEGLDRDAHGNVQLSGVAALGDALADLVKKNVKVGGRAIRVRADTFGYLQRCWPDPSPVDAKEARQVATFAVRMAARGELSGSVAIVRTRNKPYVSAMKQIELSDVAGKTRHMPGEFLDGHNNVSRSFVTYCRPLVGRLPVMARL